MGSCSGVQLVHLPGVDVDAEDVEPEAGHAGGMGDAEVPGAQHGQTQRAVHDRGPVKVIAPDPDIAAVAGTPAQPAVAPSCIGPTHLRSRGIRRMPHSRRCPTYCARDVTFRGDIPPVRNTAYEEYCPIIGEIGRLSIRNRTKPSQGQPRGLPGNPATSRLYPTVVMDASVSGRQAPRRNAVSAAGLSSMCQSWWYVP